MPTLLLYIVDLAAFLPPALMLAWRRLTQRDYFLLVVYAEILAYVHVFPLLWVKNVTLDQRALYVEISLAALVLFELPLLAIYCWARGRNANVTGSRIGIHPRGLRMSALFAIVLSLAFLFTSISDHAFFTHTSTATIETALLALHLPAYFVLRLYETCGAGMILLLVAAALRLPAGNRLRRPTIVAATVSASVYLAQRIVNSRLDVLMFCVLVAGFVLLSERAPRLTFRSVAIGILALGFAGYGYRIALLARDAYGTTGEITLAVLNPFHSIIATSNPFDQLGLRLNGVDLMAQMTPLAEQQGFAHGAAWAIPARIVYNTLTLNRSASNAYHLTLMDTAKRYLMLRYTTLTYDDYPNCTLTDLYGNFGWLGFPLGALMIGGALGTATRWLQRPTRASQLVLAIFFLQYALPFEQEAFTYLDSWVKFLPAIILFLIFNPFRLESLPTARTVTLRRPLPRPMSTGWVSRPPANL